MSFGSRGRLASATVPQYLIGMSHFLAFLAGGVVVFALLLWAGRHSTKTGANSRVPLKETVLAVKSSGDAA